MNHKNSFEEHIKTIIIPQHIYDKFNEPLDTGIIDDTFFLENFDEWNNHDIPNGFKKCRNMYDYRCKLIQIYGFALPCNVVIEKIKAMNKQVISIGCGTAYYESIMKKNNINIIASDIYNKKYKDYGFKKPFMKIKKVAGIKIAKEYPNAVIFNSWANGYWIYEVAEVMVSGQVMVHIGENGSGCTGCEEFYEYLDKSFKQIEDIRIPNYFGIHDYCMIYKKV